MLFPFITSRSLFINLWHGMPIKKIFWLHKRNPKLIELRDFVMPFYDERPDYVISTGKFSSIIHKAFRPKIGVIEMDQPRWCNLGKKISNENYILYSPTFRDADLEFFPLSHKQLLEIDTYIKAERLPKLIITLHPACQFRPKYEYSNVFFNGYGCSLDLYSDLFPNSSCVISDLSSILVEARYFGIKDYCYFPDKKNYIANSRPVIDEICEEYCGQPFDSFMKILYHFNEDKDNVCSSFKYKFNNPANQISKLINQHWK